MKNPDDLETLQKRRSEALDSRARVCDHMYVSNTAASTSHPRVDAYKEEQANDRNAEIYGQQILDGFESYRPKVVRSGKLSRKQKSFVSYVEQYYHRNNGEFPTPEQAAFALRYTLIEIRYFMQDQTVIESLMRRGINLEVLLSQHARTYLSPTQIATALTISNFADTRPFDVKLESLGVTSVEYYAWLKSPVYREFVGEMADQALENVKPEAMAAFAQLLRDGNVRALQMYFTMTGALDGENETVKNLKVTLSRVVEAVARHVQDPSTLSKISAEIGLAAPVAVDARVTIPGYVEPDIEPDPAVASFKTTPGPKSIEEITSNQFDAGDVPGIRSLEYEEGL